MGYVFAVGVCYACNQLCTFNPDKVPSYNGNPICRNCIHKMNNMRKEKGLKPFPYYPDSWDVEPEGGDDS